MFGSRKYAVLYLLLLVIVLNVCTVTVEGCSKHIGHGKNKYPGRPVRRLAIQRNRAIDAHIKIFYHNTVHVSNGPIIGLSSLHGFFG